MSASVASIGSCLRRAVAVRQVAADRWTVVAQEKISGRWRHTWLIHPATTYRAANAHAVQVARRMGLPVVEVPAAGRACPLRTNGRGVA